MKVEFKTVVDAISLQNQLLILDSQILEDLYSTEGDDFVLMFINGVNYLLEYEKAFFLLEDSIYNKLLNIISVLKTKHKEYYEDLNKIMVELNIIHNLNSEEKRIMMDDYIMFQEDYRNTRLRLESVLCCISYDAILFTIIENEDKVDIENKSMLISSINYFLNRYPDFFKNEKRKHNLEKLMIFLKEYNKLIGDKDLKNI